MTTGEQQDIHKESRVIETKILVLKSEGKEKALEPSEPL